MFDGNFYVLDQFSPNARSSGNASIRRYNINEYHHSGNFWGAINGSNKVSLDALKYASKLDAPKEVIDQIHSSVSEYENKKEKNQINVAEPNTQQVKESLSEEKVKPEIAPQKQAPFQFDPSQPAPPGTYWDKSGANPILVDKKTGAGVHQLEGTQRYNEIVESTKQNQTAKVEKKQEEAPSTPTEKPAEKKPEGPKSFNLNRQALVSAIRQTDEFKNTFGSSFATDDMIFDGFFSDARTKKIMQDTGTTYDPATGKITSKNADKLLKSFGDMNTTNILTPSERRAASESKMQTAGVSEKLQRELGVASAQAGELTPEIRSAIESQKASRSQVATPITPAAPKAPETHTTPSSSAPKAPEAPQPGKPDESSTKKFLESEGIGKKVEQVPAKAYGGEVKTGEDVSAYPISGLRGDNTLAVDTKTREPLFTFNPEREMIVPTGQDNRAHVIPKDKVSGDIGSQPNQMQGELDSIKNQMMNLMQVSGKTQKENLIDPERTQKAPEPSFDNIINTGSTFKTPSMQRAMQRSLTRTETDSMHGHYSWGNKGS